MIEGLVLGGLIAFLILLMLGILIQLTKIQDKLYYQDLDINTLFKSHNGLNLYVNQNYCDFLNYLYTHYHYKINLDGKITPTKIEWTPEDELKFFKFREHLEEYRKTIKD